MQYVKPKEGESWRVYTHRMAKHNRCSRRRVVRWLKKRGR